QVRAAPVAKRGRPAPRRHATALPHPRGRGHQGAQAGAASGRPRMMRFRGPNRGADVEHRKEAIAALRASCGAAFRQRNSENSMIRFVPLLLAAAACQPLDLTDKVSCDQTSDCSDGYTCHSRTCLKLADGEPGAAGSATGSFSNATMYV